MKRLAVLLVLAAAACGGGGGDQSAPPADAGASKSAVAVADIGRQLAATAPDPDAAPFMHLPPVERAQATAHAEYEAQDGCQRVQDC